MRLNPFNKSNPMSWQDAAKVSAIIMLTNFFTVYLVDHGIAALQENPLAWAFNAFVFLGRVFLTTFVSLTGLAYIVSKKEGA